MKLLKKILFVFISLLIIILVGGYFYFNQKFTPEKNYLTVKNESGKIPMVWLKNDKSALFLPIHFENDTTTYYLQFDTGSPYTMFYSTAIKNNKQVSIFNDRVKTSFFIGDTKVSSDQFKLFKKKVLIPLKLLEL